MRAIIIVLDGVGIGALPDAAKFGDTGANTLANTADKVRGLSLPNLQKLGLQEIVDLKTSESVSLTGSYGKMAEKSIGKDTTIGHWEMMGCMINHPFPLYPNGFPKDLIAEFEHRIGTRTLANYSASGTEIIDKLGDEHVRTGYPIVYTSADSVFQIAAHESVIPLEKLYTMCRIAREIFTGEHCVGRIIARPFTGTSWNYKRTPNRHDFGVDPFVPTVLNSINDSGGEVYAIGKINDIFNGNGITRYVYTKSNEEGIEQTINVIKDKAKQSIKQLIFTNLVDFDMLWGHRRNVARFVDGLRYFDTKLGDIMSVMTPDDVLFITADHGCDPTFTKHTDHTREYVPLLVYGEKVIPGVDIGIRPTFADLGATIADVLQVKKVKIGTSFISKIMQGKN